MWDFNGMADTANRLLNVCYSFFLKGPWFCLGQQWALVSKLISMMPKWHSFCQWLISWGFLGKLLPCGIRPCPFLLLTCSRRQYRCRAGSATAVSQSWKLTREGRIQNAEDGKEKREKTWVALSLNSFASHEMPASRLPTGEKNKPCFGKATEIYWQTGLSEFLLCRGIVHPHRWPYEGQGVLPHILTLGLVR